MKWWKYVQNLITKDNCFRVRGEGSGGKRSGAREGGKEELENILPVPLACA